MLMFTKLIKWFDKKEIDWAMLSGGLFLKHNEFLELFQSIWFK